jgi:hypothetical protein
MWVGDQSVERLEGRIFPGVRGAGCILNFKKNHYPCTELKCEPVLFAGPIAKFVMKRDKDN